MAKHRDRAFYLTVSVFALCMAAAGAWAIVHNDQSSMQQSNRTVSRTKQPDTASKVTQPKKRSSQAAKPLPTAGNETPGASPAPTTSTGSGLVQVVPYGSNVPQQAVEHTKQLLSQYNVVQWDGHRLQMQLSRPITIELVEDKQNYGKALQQLGIDPSQLNSLTQDTGGFTVDQTIVIPMYQNKSDPDLLNTLAHEITHAYINESGLNLPSWVNEGLAVTDGMNMQRRAESDVVYQGYARQMAENVIQAAANGKLIPLSQNENTVLSDSATYDVELQDWLAVTMLLQKNGMSPFTDYFSLMKVGTPESTAFKAAFGETEATVNQDLTAELNTAVQQQDSGVGITMSIPSGFKGTIHVLPRGSQTWQGFAAQPGTVQFNVLPNGKITGISSPMTQTPDSQSPDNETVYIDVSANGLKYNGQAVNSFGYAIDVHYGLYAFINSWISLQSGQTVYLTSPTVLGVQLENVAGNLHRRVR